jgi:hypothetical protein
VTMLAVIHDYSPSKTAITAAHRRQGHPHEPAKGEATNATSTEGRTRPSVLVQEGVLVRWLLVHVQVQPDVLHQGNQEAQ